MEQLELAVIGLLLFLILLYLHRLVSKIEDCSTQISKFSKEMATLHGVLELVNEVKNLKEKVKLWESKKKSS